VDAYAKVYSSLGRQSGVAFNHAVLHFDSTAYGIDHAPKLDNNSVTSALHHTSVMDGDCRVNQIAAESPKPRQRSIFVGASKPAVSDYICGQNRYELAGLDHGTLWAFG